LNTSPQLSSASAQGNSQGVHGCVSQGLQSNPNGGVCVLRWDNTYSTLRSKQLQFCIAVVPAARMKEAMRYATEHAPTWSSRSLLMQRRGDDVEVDGDDDSSGEDAEERDGLGSPANSSAQPTPTGWEDSPRETGGSFTMDD
jgi:hypothetical protein